MNLETARKNLIDTPRRLREPRNPYVPTEKHLRIASELEKLDLATVPFEEVEKVCDAIWWKIYCDSCGEYVEEAVGIDLAGCDDTTVICKGCLANAMELFNARH